MPELPPWLPLFPLHTVLFPNGILPLKIFEARYIDMVSACMKQAAPFGVVLIRDGQEVGAAMPEAIGCLAHIVEWDMQADGLLKLRTEGGRRFRILEQRLSGQLLEARIELLPAESTCAILARHQACADTLQRVIDEIDSQGLAADANRNAYCSPFARPLRLSDAGWVANRWCEILPIPLKARQKLLELDDAASRLNIVDQYLRQHHILA